MFLQPMDSIVPWSELFEVIEPRYPKARKVRPPIGLERMLRMYFMQHWFSVSRLCKLAWPTSVSWC